MEFNSSYVLRIFQIQPEFIIHSFFAEYWGCATKLWLVKEDNEYRHQLTRMSGNVTSEKKQEPALHLHRYSLKKLWDRLQRPGYELGEDERTSLNHT